MCIYIYIHIIYIYIHIMYIHIIDTYVCLPVMLCRKAVFHIMVHHGPQNLVGRGDNIWKTRRSLTKMAWKTGGDLLLMLVENTISPWWDVVTTYHAWMVWEYPTWMIIPLFERLDNSSLKKWQNLHLVLFVH